MTKLTADEELDEWRNAMMGNFLFYFFKNMFVQFSKFFIHLIFTKQDTQKYQVILKLQLILVTIINKNCEMYSFQQQILPLLQITILFMVILQLMFVDTTTLTGKYWEMTDQRLTTSGSCLQVTVDKCTADRCTEVELHLSVVSN